MLAATEAAMHGSAAGKQVPLAAEVLPRGFSATTHATAAPGAAGASAVVGPDGRLAPVDLHGLSGAEARAAVLTTLSHLQVFAAHAAQHACRHQLRTASDSSVGDESSL